MRAIKQGIRDPFKIISWERVLQCDVVETRAGLECRENNDVYTYMGPGKIRQRVSGNGEGKKSPNVEGGLKA